MQWPAVAGHLLRAGIGLVVQASTLYLERSSGLHALHPLTKLALVGLFLTAAVALPNMHAVLAVFAFLLLPLAAWGQVLLPLLRNTTLVIWPFLLSLSLIQGFFSPGSRVLFILGPWTFTSEGLLSGWTVAARLLLALGASVLLMLATRPDKLVLALTERGLPDSLAYVVLTALQIFPRFQDRARVILEAQQARGLETQVNFLRRLGLLVPLIAPLILSSIIDVEERAMALEARAFNHLGRKSSLISLEDSGGQKLLRSALLLGVAALLAFRIVPLLAR